MAIIPTQNQYPDRAGYLGLDTDRNVLVGMSDGILQDMTNSTPEGWVNVKDFGATGDGVTPDTQAFQDIFNKFQHANIFIPEGTYLIHSTVDIPFGGSYYIAGNGTIIGDIGHSKGRIFFYNHGASIKISGLKFNYGRSIMHFRAIPNPIHLTFEIENSEISNFSSISIGTYGKNPEGTIFDYFKIHNCYFHDNQIDVLISGIDLLNTIVTNSTFQNGRIEALNFQGGPNKGKKYIFSNNIFDNYLNTLPPGDADAHFIRSYGEEAIVSNNIFKNLRVQEGTTGDDTEALRLACNRVVINGNYFLNAGMAEAVVAVKGSQNNVIENNIFRNTDEYNQEAIDRGIYTVGILAGPNSVIHNNTFINFNGAVIDTEDGISNVGTIKITDNLIQDCLCNRYSDSQVFRLTAPNTKFELINNVIKTNETTDILPYNLFRTTGSSEYILLNNDFSFTNFINLKYGTIYSKNNIYRDFRRFIAANSIADFTSINDTLIPSNSIHYEHFFQSIPKSIIIRNMNIKFKPSESRFLRLAFSSDYGILKTWGEAQFKNGTDESYAIVTFETKVQKLSGTTPTFLSDVEDVLSAGPTTVVSEGIVRLYNNQWTIFVPSEFSNPEVNLMLNVNFRQL